jgi:NRAMP (natural resistance-associated macrophage protein)-like metal ion transporter
MTPPRRAKTDSRAAPKGAAAPGANESGASLTSRLGPGLITGAADDDPSGIATYSQAGAQFRFALVWTLFLTTPLMIGIQMLSARIGWVTSEGLATNIDKMCPRWLTVALIGLLVVANTINIAADVGAMAEAVKMLAGGPQPLYVLAIGVICIAMQVFFSYERTVRVLKWLTLALFAYVAVVLAVGVPWRRAIVESMQPWAFLPKSATAKEYAAMVVAVLGTTISPYLFFWQATQEVEDSRRRPEAHELRHHAAYVSEHLSRIKQDTIVGMVFSNVVALCIVLATAVTLNEHGVTNIQTSAQAAEALRPVAGEFAFLIFALGIIGTGLLAVPVLAGSAAYAVSELFGWKAGLSRGFHEARGFYLIIIAATGIGSSMGFFDVDPIRALVASAIVNGVISVPIMVVLMMIGQSKKLMGRFTISPRHRFFGWSATVVMAAAVVVMFATTL